MEQQNYTDKPTLAKWNELVSAAESVPKIATGTYTGDAQSSRFISLGFTPKAVFVSVEDGRDSLTVNNWDVVFGTMAVTDGPARYNNSVYLSIDVNGFTVRELSVSNAQVTLNCRGTVFRWLAIG